MQMLNSFFVESRFLNILRLENVAIGITLFEKKLRIIIMDCQKSFLSLDIKVSLQKTLRKKGRII